ncbi:hypothetical protein B0T17DRAFT_168498 [Bombardia bombarda]|uniref:Uncharacterized protein n=1 Tax=Bombardia bombarda TaxID=252184 RepID=A0AA39X7R2_9PEZI|nr:hypothetical protein B0T17DRAFT_168498 [Bombardia bombarda]
MRSGVRSYNVAAAALPFLTASWLRLCAAVPSSSSHLSGRDNNNPLNIDWDPAPSPEDGPPLAFNALRDPIYLPAQIGGIVGSYALSLVLVALLLLILAKTRRERLRNRDLPEEEDQTFLGFNPFPEQFLTQPPQDFKGPAQHIQQQQQPVLSIYPPKSPYKNFSLPSPSPLSPTRSAPLSPTKSARSVQTLESPTSTILAAGIDLSVDQSVVRHDRAMAQQQLEDMYRYVMEQEEAKAAGRMYEPPPLPSPSIKSTAPGTPITPGMKREKNKPTSLNLARDERTQSRGSSILSFLKSPRRNKAPQGVSISSPIMTPMSGTFPRHEEQEMNPIPHRHYAPPPPPPIPSDVLPFRRAAANSNNLPTPEMSPTSEQSIDGRIDIRIGRPPTRENKVTFQQQRDGHSRDVSATTSGTNDPEPVSATSEKSTSGLVGLPTSPKPGVNRFPSLDSLPTSPKPGGTQSFPRTRAINPSGALPLRAYEPSLVSPTSATQSTKQTVFTRAAPMSPGVNTAGIPQTPWTGAAVPYTPYQPFSPVVPITPSLVTRADRKRMKRLEPKTPTVEMVRSEDEVW